MEADGDLGWSGCENGSEADTGRDVQDVVLGLRRQISENTDVEVAWQRVDFYGLCSRCAEAKRRGELSEV